MSDIDEYAKKLGHPILEIRERALNSLSQKVKCKLVTSQQLSDVNELLPNLLKILNQGPQALWKNCISLLIYMCQNGISKKQLQSLDGLVILHSVQNVASVDLLPAIKDLLYAAEDLNDETCSEEKLDMVPEYLPIKIRSGNYFSNAKQKLSYEEKCATSYRQLSENSESIYESADDSCLEDSIDQLWYEAPQFQPITFTTFPWLEQGVIMASNSVQFGTSQFHGGGSNNSQNSSNSGNNSNNNTTSQNQQLSGTQQASHPFRSQQTPPVQQQEEQQQQQPLACSSVSSSQVHYQLGVDKYQPGAEKYQPGVDNTPTEYAYKRPKNLKIMTTLMAKLLFDDNVESLSPFGKEEHEKRMRDLRKQQLDYINNTNWKYQPVEKFLGQ